MVSAMTATAAITIRRAMTHSPECGVVMDCPHVKAASRPSPHALVLANGRKIGSELWRQPPISLLKGVSVQEGEADLIVLQESEDRLQKREPFVPCSAEKLGFTKGVPEPSAQQ